MKYNWFPQLNIQTSTILPIKMKKKQKMVVTFHAPFTPDILCQSTHNFTFDCYLSDICKR